MTIKKETLTDKDFEIIKKWIKDNGIKYLGDYKIVDYKNITKEKLLNLTYFTINYDYIPKEFFKLKNIKKLIIINRETIPKEIYNLKNLEELIIGGSKRGYKIDKIPDGITKLKKLTSIQLGFINLTKLPKELFDLVNLQKLIISNLKEINLSFNKIKKLSKNITNIKKLEMFDISN